MTEDDVVAQLESGMTIRIGGWGSRRKPMSLVRAIARSDLEDLTIVTYGGPDVGVLCALGKVRRAIYGFVSLDSIPLEPHFRNARQQATIEVTELDEGAFYLGLLAVALVRVRGDHGPQLRVHGQHVAAQTGPGRVEGHAEGGG